MTTKELAVKVEGLHENGYAIFWTEGDLAKAILKLKDTQDANGKEDYPAFYTGNILEKYWFLFLGEEKTVDIVEPSVIPS